MADGRQCESCYRKSGLFRVCFTISMFNNLEHMCSDHHYLETTMQELTQTHIKERCEQLIFDFMLQVSAYNSANRNVGFVFSSLAGKERAESTYL